MNKQDNEQGHLNHLWRPWLENEVILMNRRDIAISMTMTTIWHFPRKLGMPQFWTTLRYPKYPSMMEEKIPHSTLVATKLTWAREGLRLPWSVEPSIWPLVGRLKCGILNSTQEAFNVGLILRRLFSSALPLAKKVKGIYNTYRTWGNNLGSR